MNWISVKDRLPEKGQDVLVYNSDFMMTACVDDCGEFIESWADEAVIHNVSHWMPLPGAPDEEQESAV